MKNNIVAVAAMLISAPVCLAGDVEATGDNYQAQSYFTAELHGDVAGEKIERAHLGMERVVLFTEWKLFEDKPYMQEVRVYDPNKALVYTWHYEFTPLDGAFNTWFWWCLCDTRDAPGLWRFEVYLDEKHAFDNRILDSPTGMTPHNSLPWTGQASHPVHAHSSGTRIAGRLDSGVGRT